MINNNKLSFIVLSSMSYSPWRFWRYFYFPSLFTESGDGTVTKYNFISKNCKGLMYDSVAISLHICMTQSLK